MHQESLEIALEINSSSCLDGIHCTWMSAQSQRVYDSEVLLSFCSLLHLK
jgi:hypothetical protein